MTNTPVHILAVDDDADDRFLLKDAADMAGVSNALVTLQSGNCLFRWLHERSNIQNQKVSILLDYHMPGMNGEEILLQLKSHSRYQRIPVICYSSQMHAEREAHLISLGAYKCMHKPVYMEDSIKLVQRLHELASKHLSHPPPVDWQGVITA